MTRIDSTTSATAATVNTSLRVCLCLCVEQTSDYITRFMEPSDEEKVELYETHFDAANRRIAMRDFTRLNVYIADSNVLQTEEQQHYVTMATWSTSLPWQRNYTVTVAT